ncbi:MAG: DUF2259 domain-containing protein [Alphaproteobacteria bacterium]
MPRTSGRALALALAAGGLSAGPVHAGHVPQAAVIGFSADGRYAAYEEHFTDDVSQEPYAAIHIVDVAGGTAVPGATTAVHIAIDGLPEAQLLGDGEALARQRALEQAAPLLARYGIARDNAGTVLVHRPPSDFDALPHDAQFSIGGAWSMWSPDLSVLRLSIREAEDAACLRERGLPAVSLLRIDLEQGDGAVATTLHDDAGGLDAGRGCPVGYRLYQIVAFPVDPPGRDLCCAADYALLVLVAVEFMSGDEGTDARFLPAAALVERVF